MIEMVDKDNKSYNCIPYVQEVGRSEHDNRAHGRYKNTFKSDF